MDSFFKIKIPLPPSAFPPISMLNLAKFSCHQPKISQTTLNRGNGVFHEKLFLKFVSKVLSKIVDFDLSVFYAKILKMNRIARGLKHSWRIKRKQNCYSGILFTLFTCFVSSLFTKKSLVVHWITKLYVWNDNFKFIPDFFFYYYYCRPQVNQDYNKIQHFVTVKF